MEEKASDELLTFTSIATPSSSKFITHSTLLLDPAVALGCYKPSFVILAEGNVSGLVGSHLASAV